MAFTKEELAQMAEYDKLVDKGIDLYPLTKEQEKNSKKARAIGTKTQTVYKFTQRERKPNDDKREIMEKLKAICRAENIHFAQINAIGASEHAALGVFDLISKEYEKETCEGFCEISCLTGNITTVDDEPYIHLHATLADQKHKIHGGHVLELRVGATCEMFIQVFNTKISRFHDDRMGINLWEI